MANFCYSCTYPLDDPDARSANPNLCKMCTDDAGNLRPRDEVQKGISGWLASWQDGITPEQAMKRADAFMQAMPAWAEG